MGGSSNSNNHEHGRIISVSELFLTVTAVTAGLAIGFTFLFWKRERETNPDGTRIQGPKVYETTLYLVMIIKCPPRSWVQRRSKQHSHSKHQSPNTRLARAMLQIFCGQQFHFFISLLVESLKRTNLISFCVPLKNPTFSCIAS